MLLVQTEAQKYTSVVRQYHQIQHFKNLLKSPLKLEWDNFNNQHTEIFFRKVYVKLIGKTPANTKFQRSSLFKATKSQ